jgi:hypothetical protein
VRIIYLNEKTVVVSVTIISIPNQLFDRELLKLQVLDSEYLDTLITILDDIVVGSHDPLDWGNFVITDKKLLFIFFFVPDYQIFL